MEQDRTASTEYWLDLGSGMDAEHWCATPCPPGVRRVAIDPLITSGMIESGRLAVLPTDVRRVGAEIRPERSVEKGRQRSFLPFRDDTFQRVHCGFVLHLYLETLDLLAEEAYRVLRPEGELTVLLPHFGTVESERTLQRTEDALRRVFGDVLLARFEGPFTTFWADLYRDKTYRLFCRKQ
jgi:SAM-dependent methyltransferase